jgi:hypothetical protein
METIKWVIVGVAGIVIAVALIYSMNTPDLPDNESFLYNAYAPGYDEYFVIKSNHWLPLDTIVHFDDQAIVTDQVTGYQARILSTYTSIH